MDDRQFQLLMERFDGFHEQLGEIAEYLRVLKNRSER